MEMDLRTFLNESHPFRLGERVFHRADRLESPMVVVEVRPSYLRRRFKVTCRAWGREKVLTMKFWSYELEEWEK